MMVSVGLWYTRIHYPHVLGPHPTYQICILALDCCDFGENCTYKVILFVIITFFNITSLFVIKVIDNMHHSQWKFVVKTWTHKLVVATQHNHLIGNDQNDKWRCHFGPTILKVVPLRCPISTTLIIPLCERGLRVHVGN